jgi:7,8-dihydropterin-6-yl-methyl-4-(beta-D-ribofuranosyl)aminobenzene 5'-phosphate synthase
MIKKQCFTAEVENFKITTLVDDKADSQKSYLAQHGISFFIEFYSNGAKHTLLFDTGQEHEPIIYNANALNVNLKQSEKIFLSHCHDDHVGGLVGLLKEINKDIEIIGHTDLFRETYKETDRLVYKGISEKNSKEKIQQNGGKLKLSKEIFEIFPGAISTGQINRKIEAKPTGYLNKVGDNQYETDYFLDDMSVVFNLKEKGLFIVTGCSHAGLIEIIEHAIKITGNNKVYGIIGGLHLLNKNEDQINEIIDKLEEYNLQFISAGHCTGLAAEYLLSKKYGEKFKSLNAGKVFEIL